MENKVEKLSLAYHQAVAEKEEADRIKGDQLTALLLLEDGGNNTEKARQALAAAKTNIEIAVRRVEKNFENLKNFVARGVDDELKDLDRKLENLKTLIDDQIQAAGECVGKAARYFESLGPEFVDFAKPLKKMSVDFKKMKGPESERFTHGYEKAQSAPVENIHMFRNHCENLKRIKINPADREKYVYKLVHRALREYQ